jgi:hypothetical protein
MTGKVQIPPPGPRPGPWPGGAWPTHSGSAPRCPEPPAIAKGRHQQQPVNLKLAPGFEPPGSARDTSYSCRTATYSVRSSFSSKISPQTSRYNCSGAWDDFMPQICRGQRGDRRLSETGKAHVVWLITQRSRGSNPSPATRARRLFLEQRKGLLHVVANEAVTAVEASDPPIISSSALPAVASHTIGFADPRHGGHSPGIWRLRGR